MEPSRRSTVPSLTIFGGNSAMTKERDLEAKFWKALKSDKTMMLGLVDSEDGHTRPMTAQFEDGDGPIWFFTATDAKIVEKLKTNSRAVGSFVAKDHDLFATLHGRLRLDNNRATIERLWNPFIAAWYEGGINDPRLALLRFDAEEAEIWLNEYSLLAGLKLLLGADPKAEYKDKVAHVRMR